MMPAPLSNAEKARMVLQIFKHFDVKPGGALGHHSLLAIAMQRAWKNTDITDGLGFGLAQGWFTETADGSIGLTEVGFLQN